MSVAAERAPASLKVGRTRGFCVGGQLHASLTQLAQPAGDRMTDSQARRATGDRYELTPRPAPFALLDDMLIKEQPSSLGVLVGILLYRALQDDRASEDQSRLLLRGAER